MWTYPYQIIKRRLSLDVTELRELDWYLMQDSTSDKSAMILTAPGVYIQFLPSTTNSFGWRLQRMTVDINVILITESVLDSDKRMKKDQPLDHMRIFDKLFRSLHGFSSKISYLPEFAGLEGSSQDQRSFNSLQRVTVDPPHGIKKALMKSVQTFRGLVYDHAAMTQYTKPETPIPVEVLPEVEYDEFRYFQDEFEDEFK